MNVHDATDPPPATNCGVPLVVHDDIICSALARGSYWCYWQGECNMVLLWRIWRVQRFILSGHYWASFRLQDSEAMFREFCLHGCCAMEPSPQLLAQIFGIANTQITKVSIFDMTDFPLVNCIVVGPLGPLMTALGIARIVWCSKMPMREPDLNCCENSQTKRSEDFV
jgi:hypothetical protein